MVVEWPLVFENHRRHGPRDFGTNGNRFHSKRELDQAIATLTGSMDASGLAIQRTYAGDHLCASPPDQLRLAFTNGVMNAFQAMKGGHLASLDIPDPIHPS